jgi:hypothetical protein
MNTTSCRLPEYTDLSGLTGFHAMIVQDIRSFFATEPDDWSDLQWNAEGIARVMREFKVAGDQQHHPVLIIGAPELHMDDVFTESFEFAWNLWMGQERENGSDVNYVVRIDCDNNSETLLVRPHVPGQRLVEVRIYTKEYFSFVESPWRQILNESFPELVFTDWRSNPSLTLRDRFDYGDAYAFEGDEGLELVSVLTGFNNQIKVGTPYYIPGPPGMYWGAST